MTRLLITLCCLLFIPVAAYAATDEEYNNPGYYETNGLLGVYGFTPNYFNSDNENGGMGGGIFAYYNILNKIGGNLSIGISADYSSGKYDNNVFRADTTIMPIALNLAYMTASDFLNVWAGLAFTYTFADFDITDGNVPNRINGSFGPQGSESFQLMGGDIFTGIEYIFTQNKKFGAFFEFRVSFTESASVKRYIPQQQYSFEEDINFSRMRFMLGVAYHF